MNASSARRKEIWLETVLKATTATEIPSNRGRTDQGQGYATSVKNKGTCPAIVLANRLMKATRRAQKTRWIPVTIIMDKLVDAEDGFDQEKDLHLVKIPLSKYNSIKHLSSSSPT